MHTGGLSSFLKAKKDRKPLQYGCFHFQRIKRTTTSTEATTENNKMVNMHRVYIRIVKLHRVYIKMVNL